MLEKLFFDNDIVKKIQEKLPIFFQIAESDSSRAGKIGMEVGSVREKIIIALLMYYFGERNVDTNLPINEAEADVRLGGDPISIKTISGNLNGVKLIWTADAQKALLFKQSYRPIIDMILIQINWSGEGWFYHFTKEAQQNVYNALGSEKYIKQLAPGTNNRGVEISKEALELLTKDSKTNKIAIDWKKEKKFVGTYDKWIELWGE